MCTYTWYVHVYRYMYMYTGTCTCTYHVHMYTVCTCIQVHVYGYMYVHVHVYMYMYTGTCTCTYMYHVHMYMVCTGTCTWVIPWLLTLHFWGFGPTLNAIIYISLINLFHSTCSCIKPRPYSAQNNNSRNLVFVRYMYMYIREKAMFILCIMSEKWSGYNVTTVKKTWWVKYISKEIMALRVGTIPQKCNVSNCEIAHARM